MIVNHDYVVASDELRNLPFALARHLSVVVLGRVEAADELDLEQAGPLCLERPSNLHVLLVRAVELLLQVPHIVQAVLVDRHEVTRVTCQT